VTYGDKNLLWASGLPAWGRIFMGPPDAKHAAKREFPLRERGSRVRPLMKRCARGIEEEISQRPVRKNDRDSTFLVPGRGGPARQSGFVTLKKEEGGVAGP